MQLITSLRAASSLFMILSCQKVKRQNNERVTTKALMSIVETVANTHPTLPHSNAGSFPPWTHSTLNHLSRISRLVLVETRRPTQTHEYIE